MYLWGSTPSAFYNRFANGLLIRIRLATCSRTRKKELDEEKGTARVAEVHDTY
jgi:hypothetical protein